MLLENKIVLVSGGTQGVGAGIARAAEHRAGEHNLTVLLGTSDDELDEPLPNAERLVTEAVALAKEDHGTAALVGKPATVVERIANHEGVGCVRIDGEVWTARAYMDEETFEAGTRVQVVEIRGATALVSD